MGRALCRGRSRTLFGIGLAGLLVVMLIGCSVERPTEEDRYRDHGDGTVTDTRTDLQWMRCALGQQWDGEGCVGRAETMTWSEARAAAAEHHFNGHSDWQLPSCEALKTIVFCTNGDHRRMVSGINCSYFGPDYERPTINQSIFPGVPDQQNETYFWTSTEPAQRPDQARTVSFFNGADYRLGKQSEYRVRLLRGEEEEEEEEE